MISIDRDATYETWVHIMELGYTMFPQIKVHYVPSIIQAESEDVCSYGVSLLDLKPIEREAVHSLDVAARHRNGPVRRGPRCAPVVRISPCEFMKKCRSRRDLETGI